MINSLTKKYYIIKQAVQVNFFFLEYGPTFDISFRKLSSRFYNFFGIILLMS